MIAEKKETENTAIPLTDITGHILSKVIDYLNKHAEVETSDEDKKIWDAQFVNFEGTHILRDMAAAADFLGIEDLLNLTGERVVRWINGKTPEVIRQTFNVARYQAPIIPRKEKQEKRIHRRKGWAFESYMNCSSKRGVVRS
ncbi:hypothetical protein MKX03_021134 [Papaver bracteatum]|nr:hypothetical protein MKX03_021134 [Papaver bracteatum]